MTATAAALIARAGLPVFPCNGKTPMPGTRGFLDATTDPATVERLWATYPTANVGMATGAVSGLVVLDVDEPHGSDTLRELERRHGNLPPTTSVKTAGGGAHLYFRHPGREVRCSAGKLGTGLDIRGDGGYVLVPPSQVQGRPYVRDDESNPAPLPEWLLRELVEPAARKLPTPVTAWTATLDNPIPAGRRNGELTRVFGLLLRRLDPYVAASLLHVVNEARCSPPLPRSEVDGIVDSIARAELERGGA